MIIRDGDELNYFMISLFKDAEPPFERRQVAIRKEKWVTDEFEMLEFLGRYDPISLAPSLSI